ncbi:radical SAM family heme chaperone HemW [Apibacter adventoris]|uniref:radical SAM family heme chaperone HemW n=1 Tax=Apibacter adventoris TaxID=1679466 RepID=UPI000CF71AEF|nr:radical SAM family heme chaperone HemW [Apibacter adventoris]PQL94033.1 coproporphyrinogen III oxidase [Apibacter adventoris]
MSGIYIHIPFCRKKCNYCNFHFSTRFTYKSELIKMIGTELQMRKSELDNKPINTIYFGGGTPSLLSYFELDFLFQNIERNYNISQLKEVTLEANPDDLSKDFLLYLKNNSPVNRLSIGIQSFIEEDLRLMNRAHNSQQAKDCVLNAKKAGFENISIDLIYGGQTTTNKFWLDNLSQAISLEIPHISSYALTVESKTVFDSQIKKGKIPEIDEEKQWQQFHLMREKLLENNYIQYELSNFGKNNFFSLHNSSYWKNEPYLGIGPSAHSFNGKNIRSWNISNNMKYIKSLQEKKLPSDHEIITEIDSYNEKIMLGLRTIWGVSIQEIERNFPIFIIQHFYKELEKLEKEKKIIIQDSIIKIATDYLFQTDGIISKFFFTN